MKFKAIIFDCDGTMFDTETLSILSFTKTAERIIVDLKDKIKPTGDTFILQPSVTNEVYEEALAALVMLGFNRVQSQKVLKKLFDNEPSIAVEVAIKKALSMM